MNITSGGTLVLSLTEILFGTPDIEKTSESGDATHARGDAQGVVMDEDSASDKDGDEYAAAESEDELLIEKIPQSPVTNRTRIKSRKVVIPDALVCSDLCVHLPHLSSWIWNTFQRS
jgi:hypothetical protein